MLLYLWNTYIQDSALAHIQAKPIVRRPRSDIMKTMVDLRNCIKPPDCVRVKRLSAIDNRPQIQIIDRRNFNWSNQNRR